MGKQCFAILLALFISALRAQSQGVAPPPDMGCTEGPRKEVWAEVKNSFRKLLNSSSPLHPVSADTLKDTVNGAIAAVSKDGGLGADASTECGFGKLFLQVMSLATLDEPSALVQYISEHPLMSSPLLTMILDIPWVMMAQSGWPFFGILAQLNYQRLKVLKGVLKEDAVDGLGDENSKEYFEAVKKAQGPGDIVAMAEASAKFLQIKDQSQLSPFGTLCAMATQASVQMQVKDRLTTLEVLQKSFRSAISSPSELELGLSSRWPMWGFLHIAVDVFAEL